MTEIQRASRKELFGWAMFDFANSSYTTVIITVVFCIIFPRLIVGDGPEFRLGNLLWSTALSISYLMVLLSAPFLGAVMDYAGSKKKFLFASCLLTVLATAALYFVRPGDVILGMLLIVLSNVGFSYSESFVSSFLPGLGPPRDLGKISGYAWVWAGGLTDGHCYFWPWRRCLHAGKFLTSQNGGSGNSPVFPDCRNPNIPLGKGDNPSQGTARA